MNHRVDVVRRLSVLCCSSLERDTYSEQVKPFDGRGVHPEVCTDDGDEVPKILNLGRVRRDRPRTGPAPSCLRQPVVNVEIDVIQCRMKS